MLPPTQQTPLTFKRLVYPSGAPVAVMKPPIAGSDRWDAPSLRSRRAYRSEHGLSTTEEDKALAAIQRAVDADTAGVQE